MGQRQQCRMMLGWPLVEEVRARSLFYVLCVPDPFMRGFKENDDWTLFSPNQAFDTESGKGLIDVWGVEFGVHAVNKCPLFRSWAGVRGFGVEQVSAV